MGAERKPKSSPDPDQILRRSALAISDLRGDLGSLRWVQGLEEHLLSEYFVSQGARDTNSRHFEAGGNDRPPGKGNPGGSVQGRRSDD